MHKYVKPTSGKGITDYAYRQPTESVVHLSDDYADFGYDYEDELSNDLAVENLKGKHAGVVDTVTLVWNKLKEQVYNKHPIRFIHIVIDIAKEFGDSDGMGTVYLARHVQTQASA